jgi:hypothetical protein
MLTKCNRGILSDSGVMSSSLQPGGKFNLDFVCKPANGRFLVMAYKTSDRWNNDDSKEERRLGELWVLKSAGKCLFVVSKGKDWEGILSAAV